MPALPGRSTIEVFPMLAANVLRNMDNERRLQKTDSATGDEALPERTVWNVATLGIDERMRNALELFLKSKMNGRFALSTAAKSDLSIIDVDSYGSRDLVQKQLTASSSQHPVIMLSLKELETKGSTYFVRKPLRPQELVSALMDATSHINTREAAPSSPAQTRATTPRPRPLDMPTTDEESQIKVSGPVAAYPSPEPHHDTKPSRSLGEAASRLSEYQPHHFIGSTPDLDPSNAKQVAKASYDMDDFLIGKLVYTLRLANRANRAARLIFDHGTITLIPQTNQAVLDIPQNHLRTLAAIPVGDMDVDVHMVDLFDLSLLSPHRVWRLDSLLWLSALLASRGRVPLNTFLEAEVSLKQWPNLTRLAVFPNAVRITALLSQKPISLIDAAKALEIPQRFVFAYYSAAVALDLVSVNAKSGKKQSVKDTKTSKNRSLFKRILSHLRN
jgi:hypothetical protein